MKNPKTLCLMALLVCAGRGYGADPAPAPGPEAISNAPATPAPSAAPAAPSDPSAATPPAAPPTPPAATNAPALRNLTGASTNGLMINFRGVPLDQVLEYLSDAAGFIIVKEAHPRGNVEMFSATPLTKDEAVDLLNTVLNRNGYAAIRKGRTLTIINKDEAKTRGIPVRSGSDPKNIPDTDEIVTQIIPVRFVEVGQLIKDLQPLVSSQTAMTANESGNSIVITDTQSNIRRVAEVINAIDSGAEDVTVVKVFHLQHSNPTETSELLTSLFPDDSRSGSSQTPVTFGGFRRFFGGFGGGGPLGGGASQSSGNQNQRIKKRNRIVAVPDERTASVVVTATRDLMDQIEAVVAELDADASNIRTVSVFPLQNTDPQQAMSVLQDIFEKNGTQNSRNNANQTSVLQSRQNQQNQQNLNNTGRMGVGQTSSRRGGSFGQ
jgi:type II secretory pathway component GspD/PulD (secretin)